MKLSYPSRRVSGFSLVEVMVGLVVISVGLLGIAKMQALALSNTGSARMRSLAALEAASLASALHADRAYWSALTNGKTNKFTVTTTGSTIKVNTATLGTPTNCRAAAPNACSTADMAMYDLNDWVVGNSGETAGLVSQLPNPSSLIQCWVESADIPTACSIQITWTENLVTDNTKNAATTEQVQYTLYVQP